MNKVEKRRGSETSERKKRSSIWGGGSGEVGWLMREGVWEGEVVEERRCESGESGTGGVRVSVRSAVGVLVRVTCTWLSRSRQRSPGSQRLSGW